MSIDKFLKIGFGSWGLSGDSYGKISNKDCISVLEEAYKKGINFFDTSDAYGNGRSEKIIGNFLKSNKIRENVFIATKGGLLPHKTFYMPTNFTAEYIEKRIRNSLKNLNTDYLDLYQLHSPEHKDIINNYSLIKLLQKMKKEKIIRNIGVSVRKPNDLLKFYEYFDFDFVQLNYNIIDHRLDNLIEDGFDFSNIKVIARTPLAFGYLTGKISHKDKLEDDDHRSKWPIEQIRRWEEAVLKFDEFNQEYNLSPVLTALLFCISNPVVNVVIPGMMKSSEVNENIEVLKYEKFNKDQLKRIKEIYDSFDWFDSNAKKD